MRPRNPSQCRCKAMVASPNNDGHSPSDAAPSGVSSRTGRNLRFLLIATIAFLMVMELFATQAIIPGLTRRYDVLSETMGSAVSAGTFGMAAASLLVALFASGSTGGRGLFCRWRPCRSRPSFWPRRRQWASLPLCVLRRGCAWRLRSA